jgi:hypothetical protein
MTRFLSACATILLTTSAWAAEAQPEAAPEPPTAPLPEAAPLAEPPEPPPPALAARPVPPAAVEDVSAASEPQPYTGWGRGVRAPMYVNLMLSAGGFGEDGDNRLTTRDSKLLEGFGGIFRVGAVLGPHHRLGARMQSFVRPTKKVALEPDATATPTDRWGAVSFAHVGPEYLYASDLGIYGGASLGLGFAMSSRDVENDDSDTKDHLEKASAGVSGVLSLGYEWRASKWFAMNAEIFGGLYHGVDDDEVSMNGGLFGLAMGVGF